MSDFVKIFRWVYYFSCFIGLGYMSINQIHRYYQNEDTSIMAFHKFTRDTYPTYTLCFDDKGGGGGIYAGVSMSNTKNVTMYFE